MSLSFAPQQFDRPNALQFSSTLPVLKREVQISGESWAEALPAGRCKVWFLTRVNVQVFPVGSVVEAMLDSVLRGANDNLPEYTRRFLATRRAVDTQQAALAAQRRQSEVAQSCLTAVRKLSFVERAAYEVGQAEGKVEASLQDGLQQMHQVGRQVWTTEPEVSASLDSQLEDVEVPTNVHPMRWHRHCVPLWMQRLYD